MPPLAAGILFVLLLAVPVRAGELRVVVHPDYPSDSMSLGELTQIYLGKKTFFESGNRIIPLDFSQYKPMFYEGMLNKNVRLINQYWTKAIFSGKGTPPREFSTLDQLLAYLKATPGGIAYLPADTAIEPLKELKINP